MSASVGARRVRLPSAQLEAQVPGHAPQVRAGGKPGKGLLRGSGRRWAPVAVGWQGASPPGLVSPEAHSP